jgi:autotransporter-associated beta strand protein
MKRTKIGKLAIAAAAATAALNCMQPARATVVYWDIDGATTAGAGGATPAGTWDTGTTANWTTDSTGASAGTTWTAGDDAIFSAGGDATGAWTVAVSGTQTANSIGVEEGAVTLGAGTVSFGATNGVFTIADGAIFNNAGAGTGTITGTNGITMAATGTGTGILKLGGANTMTRGSGAVVSVLGGIVEFTSDLGLGSVPAAVNAAAVTINGGTLRFTGTSANTLNVNRGVTIGANGGTIDVPSTTNTGLSLPSAAAFTLNGAGTLTKTGAGRFTLNTTSNSFTGKYRVLGGTLNVGGDGRFGLIPASPVADYIFLDGGALRSAVTSAQTWNVNRGITLGAGGGTIYQPGAGAATTDILTLNMKITGNAGGNLTIGNTGAEGGGSADGFVVLTNTGNDYNGNTTINAGLTLRLGAAGVVPDTSIVSPTGAGATFDLNGLNETIKGLTGTSTTSAVAVGTATLTLDNPTGQSNASPITGSTGKVIKNGTGAQTFTGNSSAFTGEFILNDGTLGVGQANAFGSTKLTINGGKLANNATTGRTMLVPLDIAGSFGIDDSLIANPGQVSFNTGAITLKAANPTITVNATTTAAPYIFPLGAVIGDEGAGRGFTKAGNGVISLNNAGNTYSGNTTIQAGSINVDGDGRLGNGAGTLVLAGGGLNTTAGRTASSDPIANPIDVTADSTISTTSTAASVDLNLSNSTVGGAGVLTFINNAASGTGLFQPRFSGSGVTFAPGPIAITNGAFGSTQIQSYNTLGTTQTFANLISGNGNFRRNASIGGDGGQTDFTAANTFSGGVILSDGTLGLGSDSTLTTGPLGTGSLSVAPNGISSVQALTALGANRSISNSVAFANFNLVPLAITGANNLTLSGNVDLGGATRTLQVDNPVTELSGVVSAATTFGLTKTGAGTLKLSNANTYDGGTTVSAGTLVLGNADATAGGAIAIADGALAQAEASLPKAVSVTTINTNLTGKFDLTNNSMVVKSMSVAAVQAEIVKAFNAGQWNGPAGLTSSTAAVALPAVTAIGFADNGILNKTEFKGVTPLNATDVLVKYTYYGDSDLSGATTLDDYTLFLNGYQTAGTTWVQGDYDYNGLVTLDDFTLFLAGYQQQGAPLTALESLINSTPMSSADRSAMLAAVQAVPEPTGLALLGLGGAGLLARRRRSR